MSADEKDGWGGPRANIVPSTRSLDQRDLATYNAACKMRERCIADGNTEYVPYVEHMMKEMESAMGSSLPPPMFIDFSDDPGVVAAHERALAMNQLMGRPVSIPITIEKKDEPPMLCQTYLQTPHEPEKLRSINQGDHHDPWIVRDNPNDRACIIRYDLMEAAGVSPFILNMHRAAREGAVKEPTKVIHVDIPSFQGDFEAAKNKSTLDISGATKEHLEAFGFSGRGGPIFLHTAGILEPEEPVKRHQHGVVCDNCGVVHEHDPSCYSDSGEDGVDYSFDSSESGECDESDSEVKSELDKERVYVPYIFDSATLQPAEPDFLSDDDQPVVHNDMLDIHQGYCDVHKLSDLDAMVAAIHAKRIASQQHPFKGDDPSPF